MSFEEVYLEYYNSAGNYVYYGTVTGEHVIIINSCGNNETTSQAICQQEQKLEA